MSGPCGMEPRRGTRDSCAFPPEPAVRTHRGLLLRGTDDSALGDRLLPERDAGDGSGLVVRNEQGTVGPDEHVDGTPPCFLALEPALGEGLLGNRLPVPEAHERHPVPDLLLPVPRAVLGDEDLAAVLGGEHRTRVEPHPERRDVGAQLEGRRDEALAGKLLAELRVGDVSSVAVREPEVEAGVRREVQLVGGLSSPSQSRPLSVNHSSFVSGCQSKPTEFLTPRATISKPEPSDLRRAIEAYGSLRLQMLHGAPIGT